MRLLKSQLYELELRKQQEERENLKDKTKIEWGSQIEIMTPLQTYKTSYRLRNRKYSSCTRR